MAQNNQRRLPPKVLNFIPCSFSSQKTTGRYAKQKEVRQEKEGWGRELDDSISERKDSQGVGRHARALAVKLGDTLCKMGGMLPHVPKRGLGSEDSLETQRTRKSMKVITDSACLGEEMEYCLSLAIRRASAC